jgi:Uma2 family endonuclease
MSTAVAQRRLSVEEYLTLDAETDEGTEGAQVRYEYLDGWVWLLAGASPDHTDPSRAI